VPTQPPIQWLPVAFYLGIKWWGHEADHSALVKNAYSYTSTSPIHLHDVVLNLKKKHRDNFAFPLPLPCCQYHHKSPDGSVALVTSLQPGRSGF